MNKALTFIFELIKIIIISLIIIIPIRYFLIQPFYVKGASMEPNFYDREYLIIDEISYRFKKPNRGDIIVFRYPNNPQEYFIKRIIGLPGEKIQIKNGKIYIYNNQYINGIILEEPYLTNPTSTTFSITDTIVNLNNEEYFVLGDNRNASKDSRNFGPINKNFIIGKVFFRGWPFDKINLFKGKYKYNI